MTEDDPYIPFSQRAGLEATPPQLKIGEVSNQLRRLLVYYVGLEADRETGWSTGGSYFNGEFRRVVTDFHVVFLGLDIEKFINIPSKWKDGIAHLFGEREIGPLFNAVEFFLLHPKCSVDLKNDLSGAFVAARAAYRVIDNQIVAIGVEQQAQAFQKAVEIAGMKNEGAVRKHLIAAGVALRDSDWSDSVRESIHAVEAMATRLSPSASTLGPALASLENKGHLHGGLKAAFGALYGYTSDEEGVRHALVFNEEAKVDEADALFMLGACASFVSYLLARCR